MKTAYLSLVSLQEIINRRAAAFADVVPAFCNAIAACDWRAYLPKVH